MWPGPGAAHGLRGGAGGARGATSDPRTRRAKRIFPRRPAWSRQSYGHGTTAAQSRSAGAAQPFEGARRPDQKPKVRLHALETLDGSRRRCARRNGRRELVHVLRLRARRLRRSLVRPKVQGELHHLPHRLPDVEPVRRSVSPHRLPVPGRQRCARQRQHQSGDVAARSGGVREDLSRVDLARPDPPGRAALGDGQRRRGHQHPGQRSPRSGRQHVHPRRHRQGISSLRGRRLQRPVDVLRAAHALEGRAGHRDGVPSLERRGRARPPGEFVGRKTDGTRPEQLRSSQLLPGRHVRSRHVDRGSLQPHGNFLAGNRAHRRRGGQRHRRAPVRLLRGLGRFVHQRWTEDPQCRGHLRPHWREARGNVARR